MNSGGMEGATASVIKSLNDLSSPGEALAVLARCMRHFHEKSLRNSGGGDDGDDDAHEPGADHVRGKNCLWEVNPHERDSRVKFFSGDHHYEIDGERLSISVSGLYSRYFEQFDGDAVVRKHFSRWVSDPTHKQHVVAAFLNNTFAALPDDEKMVAVAGAYAMSWANNGRKASEEGTDMHLQIELFLNGLEHNSSSPEFQMLMDWYHNMRPPSHIPYRTEWNLYGHLVAGQADGVMKDSATGELHIYDWKRSKHLLGLEEAFRGKTGTGPCRDVEDTSYGKYVMQQNLYAYMIEQFYGFTVGSMNLVQAHPDFKKAVVIPVPRMQKVASEIMHAFDSRHPLIDGTGDEPWPTLDDECARRGVTGDINGISSKKRCREELVLRLIQARGGCCVADLNARIAARGNLIDAELKEETGGDRKRKTTSAHT